MGDQELLQQINKSIEKEKGEIEKVWKFIVNDTRGLSDQEIGAKLLEDFLEDRPFDRLSFGKEPVKLAFIDAAFKTGDMEIVTTCFGFVEQSMKPNPFRKMIEGYPQYQKIYDMLHKNVNTALLIGKNMYVSENIPNLQDLANKQENKLLKTVIEDHIKRLSGKSIEYGFEEVDNKWKSLKDSCLNKQYTLNPDQLMRKSGLFATKWKTAVDPYQAARMVLHWRAPQYYLDKFVKEIKDPNEKAFFDQKI